jgi:hypothetical protein
MSKLITREAFKATLKAIKDFVEKRTLALIKDSTEQLSEKFASISTLDGKIDKQH